MQSRRLELTVLIYILCEKAIGYFERAALMQPDDVKWQLMIASCYRRSGNYHKALETYKTIHRKFPENIECLKFLVKICSDMGLKEAMDYAQELKKAERAKDLRDRASSSRPGSRRSSSRASNLSRNGSAVRNNRPFSGLLCNLCINGSLFKVTQCRIVHSLCSF